MKKIPQFLLLLLLTTLLLNACNKDDDNTEDFTAAEAADVVSGALKANTNGGAAYLADASNWLAEGNGKTLADVTWECSFTGDSTFVATKTLAGTAYNYNMNYVYYTTCNQLSLPTQFNVNLIATGNYENNRLISADTTNVGFEFTDLLPPAANYALNGIISRSGLQTHKIVNKEFISLLVITLQNVSVSKSDYTINSGSGFITLTINYNGKVKLFSGNLSFLGNGSATFVLNGNSYTINLNE